MKINDIYIGAFGKLKDFSLEFGGNMNVIYGENENGKTTVMNFIKMMFYGSNSRSQKIMPARTKYLPWSGERAGGRINFEHENQRYTLERIFGKTDSSDSVTLKNRDTGEVLTTDREIGKTFFGLSAQAFERSLFTDSSDFSHDAFAEDELNSKLSNILSTGDDESSCKKVEENISKALLKLISKNNKNGAIREREKKTAELEDEYFGSLNAVKSRIEEEKELEEVNGKINNLRSEISKTEALIQKSEELKENLKIKQFVSARAELEDYKLNTAFSDGTILDREYEKNIRDLENEILNKKSKCENLKSDIENLSGQLKNIDEENKGSKELSAIEQENAELFKKREITDEKELKLSEEISSLEAELKSSSGKKTLYKPLFFAGILLCLLGIGLTFVIKALGIAAFILGFAGFMISLFISLLPDKKYQEKQDKYRELLSLSSSLKNHRSDISERITRNNEKIFELSRKSDRSQINLSEKKNSLNNLRESLKAEEKALSDLLLKEKELKSNAKCPDNIKLSDYLSDILSGLEKLKTKEELYKKEAGDISYEDALKKAEAVRNEDTADITQLKEKLKTQNQLLNSLIGSFNAQKSGISERYSRVREPENIKREIEEQKAALLAEYDFYNAGTLALKTINECFAEIRGGYGGKLEEKAQEILSLLTNGKYSKLSVDKTLEPEAQGEVFGLRKIDYFSSGTVDQIYLSLRLAVSSMISLNGPLPVFLDDCLSNYDDQRTENAIKALKNFSENSQVILFTCHKNIAEIAEKENIKVLNF